MNRIYSLSIKGKQMAVDNSAWFPKNNQIFGVNSI